MKLLLFLFFILTLLLGGDFLGERAVAQVKNPSSFKSPFLIAQLDEDDDNDEGEGDEEEGEEDEDIVDGDEDDDSDEDGEEVTEADGTEDDIFAGEVLEDEEITDEDLEEDGELDELADDIFIEEGEEEISPKESEIELDQELVEDAFSEPQFDNFRDVALEERLHKIYLNYQSSPITDEEWEKEFGSLGANDYEVQSGDTLWEISQIFFGDGFFWSKLWAVNGRITNPHLINKGDRLNFVGGTTEMGPQLEITQVADGADSSISIDTDQSYEVEPAEVEEEVSPEPEDLAVELPEETLEPPTPKYADNVPNIQRFVKKTPTFLLPGAPKIPEPIKKKTDVLKKFPPSLVKRSELVKSEFDELGFAVGDRPALYKEPVITLANFITDSQLPEIGQVVENQAANEVVSNYQYTYIRVDQPARIGERFTVIQKKEILSDETGILGQIIEVQGEVTITDVIDQGSGYYRAIVTNAVNQVWVGSSLINENLPRFTFNVEGTPKNIVASIIGGQFNKKRELFGIGGIVYLDRGAGQGLQVGDILAVSADRTKRLKNPVILQAPDYSALLKIVKVYNDVSTALVVKSFDDIRPGDRTGLTVLRKDLDVYVPEDDSDSFKEVTPDQFRLLEDPEELDDEEDLESESASAGLSSEFFTDGDEEDEDLDDEDEDDDL